jgi:TRAP-type C4-dicarboxylate transport system substrate-binding protein
MVRVAREAFVAAVLGLMTSGAAYAGDQPATPAAPGLATDSVQLAQSGKTYTWRMPNSLSAKDPYIIRQKKMVDRIKERTNGAVSITMYPGATLMKAGDAPKAVATGTVELESVGMVFHGGISDIAAILVPGFVGISTDDTLHMVRPGSEGRKLVEDHFSELGIWPVTFWNQADIGFVTFEPLNTVASFKGKKLRVSNEIAAQVLRALGAEPTVMGGAEAVDAMRRHIIEGSTCHPTCIFSRGYLDFAESYTPWTVVPNLGMLTMNLKVWNSLPADIKKVIQEEAESAAEDMTNLVTTIQGQAMWTLTMEHGISLLAISAKEKAKLRAIAAPIFDAFVKDARPQPLATRAAELLMQAAEQR